MFSEVQTVGEFYMANQESLRQAEPTRSGSGILPERLARHMAVAMPRRAKSGGTVGREVPDQSKEHNTEIAVEAGRKVLPSEDKPRAKR